MDFGYDARTRELRKRLLAFMDEYVYPAEPVFAEQAEAAAGGQPRQRPGAVTADLKAEARGRGLWNLFLAGHPEAVRMGPPRGRIQPARRRADQPAVRAAGRDHRAQPGARPRGAELRRPGHRQHGSAGRVRLAAEQQDRWLRPLLDGTIRSAFCMTEPDVASSDASNIATRIERDRDGYVINGRKWWSSGAMNPGCEIFIVMGGTAGRAPAATAAVDDPGAPGHPGVHVKRGITLFGYDDAPHGGHAEVEFNDVRVPAANLIAGEGEGFAIAQARLGPGRIHHCMRLIGAAERALSSCAPGR